MFWNTTENVAMLWSQLWSIVLLACFNKFPCIHSLFHGTLKLLWLKGRGIPFHVLALFWSVEWSRKVCGSIPFLALKWICMSLFVLLYIYFCQENMFGLTSLSLDKMWSRASHPPSSHGLFLCLSLFPLLVKTLVFGLRTYSKSSEISSWDY